MEDQRRRDVPAAERATARSAMAQAFALDELTLITLALWLVSAGVLVFVATGFVPPRRLATTFRHSAAVSAMVAVVVVLEISALHPSAAGLTTSTLTKHVGCFGLSKKNTAKKFPGLI